MLFTINPKLMPQLPPMPAFAVKGKQRITIPTTDKAKAYQRRQVDAMHRPFVEAEQRKTKAQPAKLSFRNVIFGVIAFLRRWLRKLSIALAVPSVQPDTDWPARPYVSLKGQPI